MTVSRVRRAQAVCIAIVLAAAVTALASEVRRGEGTSRATRRTGRPSVERGVVGRVAATPIVVADANGRAMTMSASSSAKRFRDLYPAQANATTTSGVPASNYWALLIGINDYAGSTRDNIGSYQDAVDLRKHLFSLGWQGDHVVLLTNRNATASMIVQSIRWLASKANGSSVVVFHYAGHEKPVRSSSDGDNESRDIALWASDNRLILDGTIGKEMNRVRAAKMWINLAVCRAGGFRDAGMIKSGRVLTFASPESELAYEDPAVHRTVFGWYEVDEGMIQGLADANGDGNVTVEEAYRYAKPYTVKRTRSRQHPFIVDKLSGNMYLRPPKPPPPPADNGPPPDDGSCIVIICTGATRRES